jgi:hypothetical protein
MLLDLNRSDAHLRSLEGLLRICMYCKRIHDERDSWQQLEDYISERSPTAFSHGICPTCLASHHPAEGE